MSRNRVKHARKRRRGEGGMDEVKIEVEEAFIPKDRYHELIGMPDAPDLSQFPDGIYILMPQDRSRIIGFFPESQIDKMEGKVIG